jgi:hypothetical protein
VQETLAKPGVKADYAVNYCPVIGQSRRGRQNYSDFLGRGEGIIDLEGGGWGVYGKLMRQDQHLAGLCKKAYG